MQRSQPAIGPSSPGSPCRRGDGRIWRGPLGCFDRARRPPALSFRSPKRALVTFIGWALCTNLRPPRPDFAVYGRVSQGKLVRPMRVPVRSPAIGKILGPLSQRSKGLGFWRHLGHHFHVCVFHVLFVATPPPSVPRPAPRERESRARPKPLSSVFVCFPGWASYGGF